MKQFKLDNHPKIVTGFRSPEGYFDTLYDRIDFPLKEIKEAKVFTFSRYRKRILYAVAALFVMVATIPLVTNALDMQKAPALNNQAIEDYLSYSRTVSTQEMVELLSYEDIQSLEVDVSLDTKEIESFLTQADFIKYYLID